MVEAKAENYGICCTSCQENVNMHPCIVCGEYFEHGDKIHCKHHSQTDCEHYHDRCTKDIQPKAKGDKKDETD